MHTNLSNSQLFHNRADKRIFISKKIYKYDSNTITSFFISLTIHALLIAALFGWNKQETITPLPLQSKSIPLNLKMWEPQKVSATSKTQPQTQMQKKPQPAVQKTQQTPKKSPPLTKQKVHKIVEPKTQPRSSELLKQTQPQKTMPTPAVSMPVQAAPATPTVQKAPQKELKASPPPPKELTSVSNELLAHIRSLIQSSLRYPPMAKRLGIEGVVVVAFVLGEEGVVKSANILMPSGNKSLDARALQTVLELSGEYPRPEKAIDLRIPIAFNIKNS